MSIFLLGSFLILVNFLIALSLFLLREKTLM